VVAVLFPGDFEFDVDRVADEHRGGEPQAVDAKATSASRSAGDRDCQSSPVTTGNTNAPWATRSPNCESAIASASVWSSLKSPLTPAKFATSAPVIVRPCVLRVSPTSSRSK